MKSIGEMLSSCYVDTETGCWQWRGGHSHNSGYHEFPVCKAPVNGVLRMMTAQRAAWILSGKRPGAVVWRSVCSANDCINPAHCKTGTRDEMYADIKASGRNRNITSRRVINLRSAMKMATPIETVKKAEAMFSTGASQKDVRAVFGMSSATASAIRRGVHVHSTARQRVVANASVFTYWGMK